MRFFLVLTLLMAPNLGKAAKTPVQLWEATEDMKTPESTYYDQQSGLVFVSNVAGDPKTKDGKGWISKLSLSGKVLDGKWVDGLHAPKGMRAAQGTLWVSNIDEVVAIDIESGKITQRINVPGANFLNDIAIDDKGSVYVSDTYGNKVFEIRNGVVTEFMPQMNFDGPNGLLFHKGNLVVAAWGVEKGKRPAKGRLFKVNLRTGKKRNITRRRLGNLDGLELAKNGDFIVSDWTLGKVYRISKRGKVKELVSGIKNTADIANVQSRNLLLIPAMGEDRVVAFEL